MTTIERERLKKREPRVPVPVPGPPKRRPRRGWLFWVAGLVLAGIATVAAIFLTEGDGEVTDAGTQITSPPSAVVEQTAPLPTPTLSYVDTATHGPAGAVLEIWDRPAVVSALPRALVYVNTATYGEADSLLEIWNKPEVAIDYVTFANLDLAPTQMLTFIDTATHGEAGAVLEIWDRPQPIAVATPAPAYVDTTTYGPPGSVLEIWDRLEAAPASARALTYVDTTTYGPPGTILEIWDRPQVTSVAEAPSVPNFRGEAWARPD